MTSEEVIRILASKVSGDLFKPQKILPNDDPFASLEYGDVFEGEHQLWEYPSGKIFSLKPDRQVEQKDYYATPYGENDTIWEPKLIEQSSDINLVESAWKQLNENK